MSTESTPAGDPVRVHHPGPLRPPSASGRTPPRRWRERARRRRRGCDREGWRRRVDAPWLGATCGSSVADGRRQRGDSDSADAGAGHRRGWGWGRQGQGLGHPSPLPVPRLTGGPATGGPVRMDPAEPTGVLLQPAE